MNYIRRIFSRHGFLAQTLLLLVGIMYFPALIAFWLFQAIGLGFQRLAFGRPSSDGYKDGLARSSRYVALGASLLAGAAIAVWETVAIIGAIAAKPLN